MVDLVTSTRATFLKIAADVKSKVSKGELTFNVKDYGAKGDGVTDDAVAINACFTAARTAAGIYLANVYFPIGLYMISAALNPSGCSITGYGATVKSIGGVTAFHLINATTSRHDIFGLTLDGNRANTTSTPGASNLGLGVRVYRTAASGLVGRFIDMKVINCWGPGIRVDAGALFDSENCVDTYTVVERLVADNCGWGVHLTGTKGSLVNDCDITNITTVGIADSMCRDSRITNNRIQNVTEKGAISMQYGYGTEIIGNTCNYSGFGGITIGGGDVNYSVAKYYRVIGNHCEHNWHHGITLDTTIAGFSGVSQLAYGVVSDNVCRDNGWRGANGQGIYAHNAMSVAIVGNIAQHNRSAGIVLDGNKLTATGNVCFDNGLYGIELRAAADTAADHGKYAVGDNVCYNNGVNQAGGLNVNWDIFTAPFLTDSPVELVGNGSPEGVYTAGRGSTYRRRDGGVGTTLYYKTVGTDKTGWVAIASGGTGTLPDADFLTTYNSA